MPPALAQETACGPEDLSSPSYVLLHEDNTTTNVTDLTGNVSMGDLVYASFQVGDDCQGVEVRVATFTRAGNVHTLFDESTTIAGDFASLGPALVPSCTFTVNVFTGTGPTTRLFDTDEGGEGECPEGARWWCPDLDAVAGSEGAITLTWDEVHGADAYEVWRAEGDAETGVVVATVDAGETTFVDEDTEVGATYRYVVVALAGPHRTTLDCVEVTVTAIPEFPGLAVASLAGVAAVGAYAILRRRP